MSTKTKITAAVLVSIAAIVAVAAVFAAPRLFTEHKIRAQVAAQLTRAVPTHTWQGQEERLQRVVITDCRRSLKGDKYALEFEINYTGSTTLSGCILERDEWGHYTGQWNPPGFPTVKFDVD
jgi:hypothetical protein